ncbi:MAG: hypothetical protein KF884_01215 [Fimbriimonadaceae bacterium]|nr:hypothetical protein [Fimbriimonadaceae bacterium]QYK58716.1 MAG: hypothetical protein KF884_01215 [Fimbriimonadaceae bacterium]
MRLGETKLHPMLWKAFDAYESAMYTGALGKDGASAFMAHQKAWWKHYGKGFLLGAAVWLAAIVGLAWVGKQFSTPLPMFAGMIGCGVHAVIATMRNRRTATVDEIEALLPVLNLTPLGKLYAELVVELFRADLEPKVRDAAVHQLNGLLDHHDVLEGRRRVMEAAIAQTDPAAVEAEVRLIEAKRDAATDLSARATYEHSLEMARERLTVAERYRPFLERVDAQQEVVRQTLLQVRADLGRAKAAPAEWASTTLDGLRTSNLSIRSHAEEIERAVDELSQVSG